MNSLKHIRTVEFTAQGLKADSAEEENSIKKKIDLSFLTSISIWTELEICVTVQGYRHI